jgi:hypothetical protein
MTYPIDIETSLRYKRVVYKRSPMMVLDTLLYLPIRLTLIVGWPCFLWTVAADEKFPLSGVKVIILCALLLCSVSVIVGGFLSGVLVEIRGIRTDRDRQILHELVQKYHPGFQWEPGQSLWIDFRRAYFFDNRLIVLQQGESVYIYFATLGRYEWVLFSMGIINYYRSWRIRRRFQEYLTT